MKFLKPAPTQHNHLSLFERCQTCSQVRVDHPEVTSSLKTGLQCACPTFVPFPRSHKPWSVDSIVGYRLLTAGEMVLPGDYLQCGESYWLVDGSVWVGDTLEAPVNKFSMIWTSRSLPE